MSNALQSLYIKVAEFGVTHPDGFSQAELEDKLDLNEWEVKVVGEYFRNALMNGLYLGSEQRTLTALDTIFLVVERGDSAKFILKFDAYFNYIDYLEYGEALNSSKTARKLAFIALAVSSLLALASILIQLYGSVRMDQSQLDYIMRARSEFVHILTTARVGLLTD